jgi:hypothetical protein
VTSVPLPVLWWFATWAIGAVLVNYESRAPAASVDLTAWQRALAERDEMIKTQHTRIADLEADLKLAGTDMATLRAQIPFRPTSGQQAVSSAAMPPRPSTPPDSPPPASGRHRVAEPLRTEKHR